MATAAGVPADRVSVTVVAGSVIITSTISLPTTATSQQATGVATTLGRAFPTVAALQTALVATGKTPVGFAVAAITQAPTALSSNDPSPSPPSGS